MLVSLQIFIKTSISNNNAMLIGKVNIRIITSPIVI
jgi:hypothetical protein